MNHRATKSTNVRFIVMTGILSAIATVLMMLSFSVPFMPGFIKLDFSELPALIAAFSMGPWSGVMVCLIKNLINLTMTTTGGVGELSNFLLGVFFVLPAGILYHIRHNRRMALISSIVGSAAMALLSLPLNYYLTYPVYGKIIPIDVIVGMYQAIVPGVDGLFQCLLFFNVPFTFMKGILNTVLAFLIYKRISPLIKGKQNN